ncbi:MAG: fibronectin type III domain-containing protein [Anaerolineae bacterium]|nr:fibronectin type III domain-containing protein [Anaerolineae bacterium]
MRKIPVRKLIIVPILLSIILITTAGCGVKTTVDQPVNVKAEAAVVATPDFSLKLLSFLFDSSTPGGPVTVIWEASGEFPEGFILVWSPDDAFAVPGSSGWAQVADGSAREAMVSLDASQPYFFRICKVLNGDCVGYSDPIQVVFPGVEAGKADSLDDENMKPTEAKPEKTKTPSPTPTENAIPSAEITITNIESTEKGAVTVSWTLEGEAPDGFKLLWSGSNPNPTYPENENQRIPDPAARSATQKDFTPGITYFFRVCQYLNNACQAYSNSVEFKVPLASTFTPTPKPTTESGALVITSVTETGKGQVAVSWSANGDFPKGFKVVWSKDTSTPVFPGNDYVYLSNPAARSAAVTGLTEGVKYYFRVCKYNGSGCDLYSNTYSIQLSGGGGSTEDKLVLNSITKVSDTKVQLQWSATGSFPKGFKIAYSSHNTSPVFPGDQYVYASDPAARSAYVEGLVPGETYYFRVCRYTGSGCDLYSNMKEYTVPGVSPTKTPVYTPTPDTSSISLNPIQDAGCGAVTVKWVADGVFPNGFKVVWSDTNNAPVFPGDSYLYVSDPAVRQATIGGLTDGATYYFRVCRYTGGGCDLYSNMRLFTLPCTSTKEPVP